MCYLLFFVDGVYLLLTFQLLLQLYQYWVHRDRQIKQLLGIGKLLSLGLEFLHFLLVVIQ